MLWATLVIVQSKWTLLTSIQAQERNPSGKELLQNASIEK
jgi:hypothetical protein